MQGILYAKQLVIKVTNFRKSATHNLLITHKKYECLSVT